MTVFRIQEEKFKCITAGIEMGAVFTILHKVIIYHFGKNVNIIVIIRKLDYAFLKRTVIPQSAESVIGNEHRIGFRTFPCFIIDFTINFYRNDSTADFKFCCGANTAVKQCATTAKHCSKHCNTKSKKCFFHRIFLSFSVKYYDIQVMNYNIHLTFYNKILIEQAEQPPQSLH